MSDYQMVCPDCHAVFTISSEQDRDPPLEAPVLAEVEGYFRPSAAEPWDRLDLPRGDWKVGDGYSIGSFPVTVTIRKKL